jgi:hypothetical protein
MLARQDGRRPRLSNDRYRVREACRAAQERYGLRRTAPGDRTAAPPPSRAESEKSTRNGRTEPPRAALRRDVTRAAAAAGSEEEFFALLRDSGVLVRTRISTRSPGEVTGYAVALPGDTTRSGDPVWFGGGKLAADLTLPRLRQRWPGTTSSPRAPLTSAERAAAWDQALHAVDAATAHIRTMTAGTQDGAADAAWAAAGTMHVAAALLGSRVLRQAADAYDRAARPPWARIPPPTPAGDSLRSAARILSALAHVTDPALRPAVFIARLAALAEAVARMRESQHRAVQAASALAAARHLHAARPTPALATGPAVATAAGPAVAGGGEQRGLTVGEGGAAGGQAGEAPVASGGDGGGVEVLRDFRGSAWACPAGESRDLAVLVADGEHYPVAEVVDERAMGGTAGQAGRLDLVVGAAGGAQVVRQCGPFGGGVADLPFPGHVRGDPAGVEVGGHPTAGQLAGAGLPGRAEDRDEPGIGDGLLRDGARGLPGCPGIRRRCRGRSDIEVTMTTCEHVSPDEKSGRSASSGTYSTDAVAANRPGTDG